MIRSQCEYLLRKVHVSLYHVRHILVQDWFVTYAQDTRITLFRPTNQFVRNLRHKTTSLYDSSLVAPSVKRDLACWTVCEIPFHIWREHQRQIPRATWPHNKHSSSVTTNKSPPEFSSLMWAQTHIELVSIVSFRSGVMQMFRFGTQHWFASHLRHVSRDSLRLTLIMWDSSAHTYRAAMPTLIHQHPNTHAPRTLLYYIKCLSQMSSTLQPERCDRIEVLGACHSDPGRVVIPNIQPIPGWWSLYITERTRLRTGDWKNEGATRRVLETCVLLRGWTKTCVRSRAILFITSANATRTTLVRNPKGTGAYLRFLPAMVMQI